MVALLRTGVTGRLSLSWAVFAATLVVAVAAAAPAAGAGRQVADSSTTTVPVRRLGTVNVRDLAASARFRPAVPEPVESPGALALRMRERAGEGGGVGAPSESGLATPTVPGEPVVLDEVARGFEGLTARDAQFTNVFDSEPPDQGLCGGTVGDTTFLIESVNSALAIYDTEAIQYTPPIDLNSFFGLAPATDAAKQTFGPFVTDPKCYFDPDTRRWFHTVAEAGLDPVTGEFTGEAATLIAVSASDDPAGTYTIYSMPTDPAHPHCPCFGDQPLLGADANGLYVTTAEFNLVGDFFFNGAQIFALDKRALESGDDDLSAVEISPGTEDFTTTVQPATTPSGRYATERNGTEYFMSSINCGPPDCPAQHDSVTVWALTNTASLREADPDVKLSSVTLRSEVYAQPVPQTQAPGPLPLGASLGEALPLIDPIDDRMTQVVFAADRLWSAISTAVLPGPRNGIAWVSVDPSVRHKKVSARIDRQGYIAAQDAFLAFPSVGVNDAGDGVVAYSAMGPTLFPSAARTDIRSRDVVGPVRIARRGFRPEDGFTCYREFSPPEAEPPFLCRFGDYSASFALPNGEVWSATEIIGDVARTEHANWSTFIWPVQPDRSSDAARLTRTARAARRARTS